MAWGYLRYEMSGHKHTFLFVDTHFKTDWDSKGTVVPLAQGHPIGARSALMTGESKGDRAIREICGYDFSLVATAPCKPSTTAVLPSFEGRSFWERGSVTPSRKDDPYLAEQFCAEKEANEALGLFIDVTSV